MIITREFVDMVAPEHERTSCDDDIPCNFGYRIKDRTFHGYLIERTLESSWPCARCYLLKFVGYDTDDLEFEIIPRVLLRIKQPEIDITDDYIKIKI